MTIKSGTPFTNTERAIIALSSTGLSRDDVGRELCISPNTVKNHLTNIAERMGLSADSEYQVYSYSHFSTVILAILYVKCVQLGTLPTIGVS